MKAMKPEAQRIEKIERKPAPQLPQNISNDGREIWDWGMKMSEHIHRQAEINRLTRQIRLQGTKCGDCYKWMKSQYCPRERRNSKGRREGPSMNAPICTQFEECPRTTEWREELKAQLAKLTPRLNPHKD